MVIWTKFATETFLSYIIRSDFQVKILNGIHNKNSELLEYNIHGLSISTATGRDSIAMK